MYVNIIVYPNESVSEGDITDDDIGTNRIEYCQHVIQILNNYCCVISDDGQTVLFENKCLLKCFEFINSYTNFQKRNEVTPEISSSVRKYSNVYWVD